MNRRILTVLVMLALSVATIVVTIGSGVAQFPKPYGFELPGQMPEPANVLLAQANATRFESSVCALRPDPAAARQPPPRVRVDPRLITLSRFRQPPPIEDPTGASTNPLSQYTPREEIQLADSSNYGDRFLLDIDGKPANLNPIIVLHETVGSASSALNLFRTYHARDDDQVSYHTLIRLDGTLVYVVPPDKRAYGAGNSVFAGENGTETVRTKSNFPPSVNNFAYHISLETPYDGNDNAASHSGYTDRQYQSLAWLVARTGVPDTRITTHRGVDRSGQRRDPRSFSTSRFRQLLNAYPRTSEILIRCLEPAEPAPSAVPLLRPLPPRSPSPNSSPGSPQIPPP